jgi:methyl-accepting chemotaxis protein
MHGMRADQHFHCRPVVLPYANPRALETLRGIEQEAKQAFGVEVDDIVGGSIHRFHKNSQRVEQILANTAGLPHLAEFSFRNITLQTKINGIFSPAREILGYIVNWEDVSDKLAAERQVREASERERQQADELRGNVESILEVVDAASRGPLTREVSIKGQDTIGLLGESLGKFLATCAADHHADQ